MITKENTIIDENCPLLRELFWKKKYVCSSKNILINNKELFYWPEIHKSELDNLNLTSYCVIEDMNDRKKEAKAIDY